MSSALFIGCETCRPQKLALRVSFRLVAEQSGARWHFSKRVFVMQATEDRFHEDERGRRQAVAVFYLRDAFMFLGRIWHTRSQRAMRTSAVVMCHPTFENRA